MIKKINEADMFIKDIQPTDRKVYDPKTGKPQVDADGKPVTVTKDMYRSKTADNGKSLRVVGNTLNATRRQRYFLDDTDTVTLYGHTLYRLIAAIATGGSEKNPAIIPLEKGGYLESPDNMPGGAISFLEKEKARLAAREADAKLSQDMADDINALAQEMRVSELYRLVNSEKLVEKYINRLNADGKSDYAKKVGDAFKAGTPAEEIVPVKFLIAITNSAFNKDPSRGTQFEKSLMRKATKRYKEEHPDIEFSGVSNVPLDPFGQTHDRSWVYPGCYVFGNVVIKDHSILRPSQDSEMIVFSNGGKLELTNTRLTNVNIQNAADGYIRNSTISADSGSRSYLVDTVLLIDGLEARINPYVSNSTLSISRDCVFVGRNERTLWVTDAIASFSGSKVSFADLSVSGTVVVENSVIDTHASVDLENCKLKNYTLESAEEISLVNTGDKPLTGNASDKTDNKDKNKDWDDFELKRKKDTTVPDEKLSDEDRAKIQAFNKEVATNTGFSDRRSESVVTEAKSNAALKYALVKAEPSVGPVFQIRALKDFTVEYNGHSFSVAQGDFGGYVDSEDALDQNGDCWIGEGAFVTNGAVVKGNSVVVGKAVIKESRVLGDSYIDATNGDIDISGRSTVQNSMISGNVTVYASNILRGVTVKGTPARPTTIDTSNISYGVEIDRSYLEDCHVVGSSSTKNIDIVVCNYVGVNVVTNHKIALVADTQEDTNYPKEHPGHLGELNREVDKASSNYDNTIWQEDVEPSVLDKLRRTSRPELNTSKYDAQKRWEFIPKYKTTNADTQRQDYKDMNPNAAAKDYANLKLGEFYGKIRALVDIDLINGDTVFAGEPGGWLSSERALAQGDPDKALPRCWVDVDSVATGNTEIAGDALAINGAKIINSKLLMNAIVDGSTIVTSDVSGHALISDGAVVEQATISGKSQIKGNVHLVGHASDKGDCEVTGGVVLDFVGYPRVVEFDSVKFSGAFTLNKDNINNYDFPVGAVVTGKADLKKYLKVKKLPKGNDTDDERPVWIR